MIQKYKKRPVKIEVLLWDGQNHREMATFLGFPEDKALATRGENFFIDHDEVEGGLIIKTLEGNRLASIGDYIIKGVQGEFYPCKPDIFKQTYEEVFDGDVF